MNACGKVYTCWVCGEEIIGTVYDAYRHLNFECDSIKIYNDICESKRPSPCLRSSVASRRKI